MLKLALSGKLKSELIYKLYFKGNLLLSKNSYELAEKCYTRVLKLRKNGVEVSREITADIFHNLGMIAETKKDFDSAIGFYQQSLSENCHRSMTWLFLAKLFLERFESKQQDEDYRSGLDAIHQAELSDINFPAIQFMKKRYQIA